MKQNESELIRLPALVLRTGSGLAAILAAIMSWDLIVRGSNSPTLMAFQFGVIFISLTTLTLTYEEHFAEVWHIEAALFFTSLLVISIGAAFVNSDYTPLIVLALAIPIATVLLPWIWQFQLAIAIGVLGVGVVAAHFAPTTAQSNFFWIAIGAETSVSVIAAALLERERDQQRLYCEALADDELQFRSLIENSPDGLTVLNRSGTIAFVGPSVNRLLGYPANELPLKSIFEFVHNDDAQSFRKTLTTCSDHIGRSEIIEMRCRHADGSWRTIEAIGRRLDFGREPLVVFNWRDITERAQQDARLRESEEKFRRIFQFSTNVISIASATDGRYLEVNDEFLRVSGYQRHEVIGKTPLELGLWADPRDYVNAVVEFLQYGELRERETNFRTRDGVEMRALFSAVRLELNDKPMSLGITTILPHHERL